MCEHFSSTDVENAKRVLWDYCRQELEAAGIIYHARRGSDKRCQLVANIDDILEAFVALVSTDLIPGIYCEATDLLRIPSLSLDPISEKIETNTLSLKDLAVKIDLLEAKMASFSGASNNPPGQASYAAIASTPAAAPAIRPSLSQRVSSKPPSPDGRDCNLILFGLPESRSIVDTKDSVDEMLEFLAGKPIPVKDVFRLGKYASKGSLSSHRPRPVLVKLTTPWDRKLILLRKRNLCTFKVPRLFLREDVPPDHKLRVKIPTKGAGQSPSTDAPPVSGVSTVLPQSKQSLSSVATSSSNQDSEFTRDSSPHASLASLPPATPDGSPSSSPTDLLSSTSSSGTIVQGNSNTS